MKKEAKKIDKMYSGDHVMAMFEELKDNFKVFGEGQSLLINRVDSMEVKIDAMDGKIGAMEVKIDAMDGKIGAMEVKIDRIENKIETIEKKIDRLQDDMVEVKYDLKRKVDYEEFEKLEKRTVKLEKLVFSKMA